MNPKSNKKVPLTLIIDAIEMADNEWKQFLDIEEMEIVSLPEYPFAGEYNEEDQELADLIEEEFHVRFFRLPSQFDIHEYSIMEQFIENLPEGRMQDSLEHSIQGRGAFRRFKDSINRYGIEQSWYDYEAQAYGELAKEWCEDHDLAYIDDRKPAVKEKQKAGYGERDPLAWEEVHTEHIIQDEWIDFRRSTYRFPDGSVFEPFYSYSRRDYVVIVASDTEENYLCVRQFRQGIRQVTTEFPAGGIERRDGKEYGGSQDVSAEDALEAAKRELLEETGYESDEWKHLLTVPSNATIADNYAHLFAARNCRQVSGQSLDETEFLKVGKLSAQEIEEKIAKGEFQQAVHITAWLLALRESRRTDS